MHPYFSQDPCATHMGRNNRKDENISDYKTTPYNV